MHTVCVRWRWRVSVGVLHLLYRSVVDRAVSNVCEKRFRRAEAFHAVVSRRLLGSRFVPGCGDTDTPHAEVGAVTVAVLTRTQPAVGLASSG